MGVWVYMYRRMKGWMMSGYINGWMDEGVDGWIDGCMNGWMDECMMSRGING